MFEKKKFLFFNGGICLKVEMAVIINGVLLVSDSSILFLEFELIPVKVIVGNLFKHRVCCIVS